MALRSGRSVPSRQSPGGYFYEDRIARMSPQQGTTRQVREFVERLPDDYLDCRQFGHNWSPYTVEKGRDSYRVTVRCPRCTARCIHVINRRTGDIIKKPSRSYPPDYLAPHGMGRLDGSARSVIRLENANRMVNNLPSPEEVEEA